MSTATVEPALEERAPVDPDPEQPPDEQAPGEAQPGSTPPEGEPEPEQPDFPTGPTEPGEEQAPDPEREPVQAREPSRAQLRSLDAERERHLTEVHEIMGEFVAGMLECEHCSGLGLQPPDPEPRTHPWYKECPTCAGYGQVLTGSRDEQHRGVPCPRCVGRGYLEALDSSGTPLRDRPPAFAGEGAAGDTAVASAEGAHFPADPATELEPATHGTPAWMGDTSLNG